MHISEKSARTVLERTYPGKVTDFMVREFVQAAESGDLEAAAAISQNTWYEGWVRSILAGGGLNELQVTCMIAKAQCEGRACRWVPAKEWWVILTRSEDGHLVPEYAVR